MADFARWKVSGRQVRTLQLIRLGPGIPTLTINVAARPGLICMVHDIGI